MYKRQYIKNAVMRDPRKLVVQINLQLKDECGYCLISDMTVRLHLIKDLFGRQAVKKSLLTKAHINAELQFAQECKYWTTIQWRNAIFSDESFTGNWVLGM